MWVTLEELSDENPAHANPETAVSGGRKVHEAESIWREFAKQHVGDTLVFESLNSAWDCLGYTCSLGLLLKFKNLNSLYLALLNFAQLYLTFYSVLFHFVSTLFPLYPTQRAEGSSANRPDRTVVHLVSRMSCAANLERREHCSCSNSLVHGKAGMRCDLCDHSACDWRIIRCSTTVYSVHCIHRLVHLSKLFWIFQIFFSKFFQIQF